MASLAQWEREVSGLRTKEALAAAKAKAWELAGPVFKTRLLSVAFAALAAKA